MNLTYEIRSCLVGQRLNIEGFLVGEYPISYTVDECLEDFCEEVRWELDQHASVMYTNCISGMVWVERPVGSAYYRATLRAAEQRYRHGRNQRFSTYH